MGNNGFPEGKYMTTVKVGPKGQIVIPAEVREMFGIEPGDQLLLLADTEQGHRPAAQGAGRADLCSHYGGNAEEKG